MDPTRLFLSVQESPPTHFGSCVDWTEEIILGGIQFLTDEKNRKVGVLIDRKKHGATWQDFWDGLVSECRRKEKSVLYEQYLATRLKRTRSRV